MNIKEFLKDYYNSNKNKYGTTEDELYDIAYDVKEDFEQLVSMEYPDYIPEYYIGNDEIEDKKEKTFNDFYKDLNLENDEKKLHELYLYTLCRYNIQDTEFDDKFIDELYNFYEYLNENHYSHDLDLDTYISILSGCVEKLKIDLRDIDLDELAKEFED